MTVIRKKIAKKVSIQLISLAYYLIIITLTNLHIR